SRASSKDRKRPRLAARPPFRQRLRRRGKAEDVAIAERGLSAAWAIPVRRRPRHGPGSVAKRQPPGIDCRAVRAVARVVPDAGSVGIRRHRVDVVAEELAQQVVLARSPRVAIGATVDLAETSWYAIAIDGGVQHDAVQVSGRRCRALECRCEGVVGDVYVLSTR